MRSEIELVTVAAPGADLEAVRRLFVEYAEAAITHGRAMGYRRMCLDTLPSMKEARALYHLLGFRPCAPYYDNSCVGSDCFELGLDLAADTRK